MHGNDRSERHDYLSRFLLLHSPFLFLLFFRREEKKGKEYPKSWSKVMPFVSIMVILIKGKIKFNYRDSRMSGDNSVVF